MRLSFFVVLAVLSLVTRLPELSHPHQLVFDEVHFGNFITSYCCSGERFFDIHPPHGKLMIAGLSYLGGYRGNFKFERIGQPYDDQPVAALRLASAAASVVIPLLVYVLLRQVGVSKAISFLGGALIVFDNAHVIQSRLIALDSMLLASILGSLALFLYTRKYDHSLFKRFLLAFGAGACAGFAIGVKVTGLAAIALIASIIAGDVIKLIVHRRHFAGAEFKRNVRALFVDIVGVILGAVLIYIAGWAVHFGLLTQPGPGDAWGVLSGNFWTDFIQSNRTMLSANYNLTATHPYSSTWWSWPFMQRPVFYWVGDRGAAIYFIGNPVVWWGGGILFISALIHSIVRAVMRISYISGVRAREIDSREEFSVVQSQAWIFIAGYVVAFLPFVRIPRALFLYHYMMPLLFSLLFVAVWADHTFWGVHSSGKQNAVSYSWLLVLLGVVVAGFVLFLPITYGIAAPAWQAMLVWFPTWR